MPGEPPRKRPAPSGARPAPSPMQTMPDAYVPPHVEDRPAFGDDDDPTQTDPNADPLIGTTVLGQFEIVEQIGDGGYGTVYLANQLGLSRKAVLKVVNTESSEDAEVVLRRFEREAKVLAALEHPHFVRLYNFGQLEDGRPFLAMEYGGDTNVSEEVKKLKKLPVARALLIAEQVCEALDEAHRRGIVHRDMKPHNILLGRRDGLDWVKIVDLGIAKIMDASTVDDAGSKLTGAGLVIGTPAYFSPEQCHGVGLDGRSDLYTLGIVLYEMLSGKLPLQGVSSVDYVRAHVVDTPQPLSRHVEVPKAVEALVMKALKKKAAERFQSAAQMRDAIRAAREQLPGQSPTGTTKKVAKAKTTTTAAKKPRSMVPLYAAGVIALLGAAGGGVWLATRPDPTGSLLIQVKPDTAELLLDGRRIAPGKHVVAPGRHRITARAEGFSEQSQVLRVKEDESLPVDLTLNQDGQ